MSSDIDQQVERLSREPWESVLPTDQECDRVLERFPTLTEVGLYTREKHQRENEWRRQNGLPPVRHRPPVPVTNPDQRRQIGLVRVYLRAIQTNIGEPLSKLLCSSYELQHAVARWVGQPISKGATIAGALLEEGCKVEPGAGATVFIWLSVRPEVHAGLSVSRRRALDHINGALACVPA